MIFKRDENCIRNAGNRGATILNKYRELSPGTDPRVHKMLLNPNKPSGFHLESLDAFLRPWTHRGTLETLKNPSYGTTPYLIKATRKRGCSITQ